ncbi:MAG TPA: CRISPR-associated protein Csx11, partial [Candidatus Acetothermia bacterium]|nr:CRISPR-associated protein Csx11 [Candidatus Acetothermia bacterium]
MSYDLKVLADNRDALLLAEVAGWLHDMGKCSDEHIVHQASDKPANHIYQYKTAYSHLLASVPALCLLGESISLQELVEEAKPSVVGATAKPWLLQALGRCHAAAHIEKETTDKSGKQSQLDTRLSNAFGYESASLRGLAARLKGLPFSSLTNRHIFRAAVRTVFTEAPGETRRPENEVTLWDWSSIVAALYKAALAGALLGYQPLPNELRWRLLSVRVDDVTFFGHVAQIPDLLARQRLLADAFDHVRILLEETYSLGTRVYQDENSSVYVVPNLPYLLDFTDAQGTTLRDLIYAEFAQGTVEGDAKLALAGEVIPLVKLDKNVWWGQRPDRRKPPETDDEIPPIAAILRAEVSTHADAEFITFQWTGAHANVCPVCGLRPQEPSKKELDHKVCDVCEHRRAGRAKEWTGDPTTTIWIDEVADPNGRLALVVGQFDLTHWLAGTLVKTLLATDPSLGKAVQKNPSFARLRRVWETTRSFWQSALEASNSKGEPVLQPAGPRLVIQANNTTNLKSYCAYNLLLGPAKLGVLYRKSDLITISNLRYVSRQLGANQEQYTSDVQAATFVQQWLGKHGPFGIEEPTSYGKPGKLRGQLSVDDVQTEQTSYTPVIPILAEPRTFMALVPADKALGVINGIKAKYEREMGKVRNRLPLTLGTVYCGRHTPLAAALNAGRRMIDHRETSIQAQVVAVKHKDALS